MKRRICVVTGSRAEYGLLKRLLILMRDNENVELQIIATGTHLSPDFGLTYKEIENDQFVINKKIEILLSSDSDTGTSKSIGLATISFSEAYAELKPDIVFVVGDRYEIFAAIIPAFIGGIPIAHHSGGEITQAAIDDSIRHCITKMSHFHFVAMEEYRKRVIQLGEQPATVYEVGGFGVDNILAVELVDREKITALTGYRFAKKNILVTFHPVTLESDRTIGHLHEVLNALDALEETNILFTLANADPLGRQFNEITKEFVAKKENCWYSTSLGQKLYYSCLNEFDLVLGNSSSGLGEAPTFKIPTINIGNRQEGRVKAASVIDCLPEKTAILEALEKAYSPGFQNTLPSVVNPYGTGGASEKVIDILLNTPLADLTKKVFFDVSFTLPANVS